MNDSGNILKESPVVPMMYLLFWSIFCLAKISDLLGLAYYFIQTKVL